MDNIRTSEDLKNALLLVEAEHEIKLQLLKDEIFVIYESLKPMNLLKKSIKDVIASPDIADDILNAASGFISEFISKRIIIGDSDNPLRKILGASVQFAIINFFVQNSEAIKNIGHFVISKFFQGKDIKTEVK